MDNVVSFDSNKKARKNNALEPHNDALYPEVFSENGMVCTINKSGDVTVIGKDIILEKNMCDIDKKEYSMQLTTNCANTTIEHTILREDLCRRGLLGLAAKGFDIFEFNVTPIIKHIRNQQEHKPIELNHSLLGWGIYGGSDIYKFSKAIGVKSKYSGRLMVGHKGDPSTWFNMVASYVLGFIPLEASLIEGLSAVLLGYIGKDIGQDTLLIHKYNTSSMGKTTAIMLALSCSGCPDLKNPLSLIGTWSATENALIHKLRGNYGIPIGMDESSMSDDKDLTKLMYRIPGNVDKYRLNKNSQILEPDSWCTTVISTGEFPLTEKTNKNSGIRARVIEEGNVQWTPDADTSNVIKQIVLNNYGYAGPVFARKLLEYGKECVISHVNEWSQYILEKMPDLNNLTNRLADKLAILLATTTLSGAALGIEFDKDGILEFYLDNALPDVKDVDLGKSALNFFLEQFHIHRDKFQDYDINSGRKSYGEFWGTKRIISDNGLLEICILPDAFKTIMKKGGFEGISSILSIWKNSGILNHENDRNTRTRNLGSGKKINVYCIVIPNTSD